MSQYIQTPPPTPGIPPSVGLPVQQKKSGCLKYILIGGAIILVIGIIGIMTGGDGGPPAKPVDAEVTLKQAESNIVGASNGLAYSNTETGQALATKFNTLFKNAAMEGTSSIKERHDFITHCQLNADSALFLVHVPKLRKFDKESKEVFCKLAWEVAQAILTQSDLPDGSKVAVGVKGLALYQNIYFGTYAFPNGESGTPAVTRKSKDSTELEVFFQAAAPATTTPDEKP